MIFELTYAFFATVGFAYIFNAPKKSIFTTGVIGALGWIIYSYFVSSHNAAVMGSFIGAFVVAVLSEISARLFKMPVTIFLISGIIPLVPGSGLYYTMLALVQKNYGNAISIGTETIFAAGSIAVAIALVSSLFKRRKK